ncbi:DUF6301 family protein [Nocardia sp. NPDC058058]|uniref:DUF6301 family protein n=1 Tax=Nocardia sp. NPDC058058 TaxID=3346317 RepID=UPI0036DC7A7B
MRVDFDRAVHVVQAAMGFDWTWTIDDLPGFTERVGWQLDNRDPLSPVVTTDLEVGRPDALVFLDSDTPRSINEIWFFFSDVVLADPTVKPLLSNAFDDLAQRIFDLVGERPTGWWWRDPDRTLRWDLSNMVLELAVSDISGSVRLISPTHQAWQDENDRHTGSNQAIDLDTVWRGE